jgi:hypothetical protein
MSEERIPIGWTDISAEIALEMLKLVSYPADRHRALSIISDGIPAGAKLEYISPMPGRIVRLGFSGPGVEARIYAPLIRVVNATQLHGVG